MEEYKINNKYTLDGKWFFPKKHSITFYGQLIYDPEMFVPKLNFWANNNVDIKDINNNSIFLGHLTNGTPITLLNVTFRSSRQKTNENSFFSCECDVYGSILIGKHFNTIEEIILNELNFNFTGLSNLTFHDNFKSNYTEEAVSINYDIPNNISICKYENLSYEIFFLTEFNLFGKDRSINQKECLNIKSSNCFTYDDIEKQLNIFNNFLIFLTNKRSNTISVFALDENENQIGILNYWNKKRDLPELNQGMSSSVMFTSSKVSLEEQLLRWLKLYKDQESALSNFFYALSTEKYYIQEDFVLHVQILEDIHRHSNKFRQEKKPSDSQKDKNLEYHKMISAILESCPPKHAVWLRDKLEIGNEVTLPDRIQEIIKEFKIIFEVYLKINGKTKSELVKKIVGTRNYFTHRSDQSKNKAIFNMKDIDVLTELIRTMINSIILYEMNYSVDIIKHEIYNKECFYSLLGLIQKKQIDWNSME